MHGNTRMSCRRMSTRTPFKIIYDHTWGHWILSVTCCPNFSRCTKGSTKTKSAPPKRKALYVQRGAGIILVPDQSRHLNNKRWNQLRSLTFSMLLCIVWISSGVKLSKSFRELLKLSLSLFCGPEMWADNAPQAVSRSTVSHSLSLKVAKCIWQPFGEGGFEFYGKNRHFGLLPHQ